MKKVKTGNGDMKEIGAVEGGEKKGVKGVDRFKTERVDNFPQRQKSLTCADTALCVIEDFSPKVGLVESDTVSSDSWKLFGNGCRCGL